MTSTITINGVTITADTGNVSIINGKVIVDGKEIEIVDSKLHNINIEGNINNLNCRGNVVVNGDVGGDIDCGGSVRCGDVGGEINAGGSVHGSDITGNIDAGGSVSIKK